MSTELMAVLVALGVLLTVAGLILSALSGIRADLARLRPRARSASCVIGLSALTGCSKPFSDTGEPDKEPA